MMFAIEKYEDIVPEIEALYDIAVLEAVKDCKYTHDVDHQQFIDMENIGILQVITARSDDELVGFHVSTVTDDIFYKGKKTAYVLHYFLMKEHRKGGNGLKMFEYAEDMNIENNVDRSFMSRKIHLNNEKLFDKLGYSHIEANYEKYYD